MALSPEAETLWSISSVVGFLAFILSCWIVCAVRMAIRRRDGIKAGCWGDVCEDCCSACCCNPCTQCQIFRHEKVSCKHNTYSLCAPEATPV